MLAAARLAPCGARHRSLHAALPGSARGLGTQPSAPGSRQRAAGAVRRTAVSASRRPAGDDSAAAGRPEPTLEAIMQKLEEQSTKLDEQSTKLDEQNGQLKQMREEQNGQLKQMREEQNTLLGSVFEVAAAAVPERHRRRPYDTPVALASDCGLPHDAAAKRRLEEKLLDEHAAAHAFREQLMRALPEQEGRLTVVSSWRSLPPPKTEAEWTHEAQLLGEVAGALKPNFELQQAVLLLRKYCTAAAREGTEGRGPLLQLLESVPPPGALVWPPAMSLALALAGMRSRQLEFDAALRFIRDRDDDSILIIQETKLRATGVSKAVRQLRQAFRLVAWLHFALGAALPRLEGRIVVPGSELRDAQRKLRGTSGAVQDSVPGEAGAKFTVSIKAYTT